MDFKVTFVTQKPKYSTLRIAYIQTLKPTLTLNHVYESFRYSFKVTRDSWHSAPNNKIKNYPSVPRNTLLVNWF